MTDRREVFTEVKEYEYVGPPEIKESIRQSGGFPVRTASDLQEFLASRGPEELNEPFTFIVDTSGVLRLAPRRSEHVACADGCAVWAAGEIGFHQSRNRGQWEVSTVSNQSTGYCPDTESWESVARSLDHAGINHGSGYTHPIIFRCCPSCREWNSVKDSHFFCVFCDNELPAKNRR
ncbi:hypothetical protein [Streptomyces sp. NBC_00620]|uniref:hypothetical protein n=1 Tax=Streptomyces sp. NBC_00620 TaxID=2903666 RepID=UPI00225BC9ED|nr:hypothetical protein [Streptomyces sp. NBC_00620]MCX4973999.1 hypothetical protein [Streptomyces sp. NBC_00620]